MLSNVDSKYKKPGAWPQSTLNTLYLVSVLFEFYILLLIFRSIAAKFDSPLIGRNKYTMNER